MVDGVSGAELLSTLLDFQPDAALPEEQPWAPAPEPSGLGTIARAVGEQMLIPAEGVRWARAALRTPRRLALGNARAVKAALIFQSSDRPDSLNGPIGPHRRYAWASGDLADIKTIRAALGGTVNDVILAAVTNGFRQLLVSRGEDVAGRTVRSLVPVLVRGAEAQGVPDNRVSAMWAELPHRHRRSGRAPTRGDRAAARLKKSGQALGGEVLTSLGNFASPMLLALDTRASARAPQRFVQTVTTNVPGPQVLLYCWGRRAVAAYSYVPLGSGIRIASSIFSYDGGIYVGVTGDYDAVPDIDVLCKVVQAGLTELVAAGNPSPSPEAAPAQGADA